METNSSAGDPLAPAFDLLQSMGYQLIRTPSVGSVTGERWMAQSQTRQFLADEVRTLLNLVSMYENCAMGESTLGAEQAQLRC